MSAQPPLLKKPKSIRSRLPKEGTNNSVFYSTVTPAHGPGGGFFASFYKIGSFHFAKIKTMRYFPKAASYGSNYFRTIIFSMLISWIQTPTSSIAD